MITELGWSFQHTFWLTANIYPIDKPAHPIIIDIKTETLAFRELFINLTVYKKHPEPHLTQNDVQFVRELMDTAEFHMGINTGYYIQKKRRECRINPTKSRHFWWCQNVIFTAVGASICTL